MNDEMNDDRMRRLRAYVLAADATMGKIPVPVPPKPEEGWDGPTFGTHEMYLAYSQLPADLQELAATTHVLCENALQAQRGAALRALTARYAMAVNVVQATDLARDLEALYEPQPAHEYLTLVKDEDDDDADAEEDDADEGDDAESTSAEMQRDIDAYVRGLVMERERANAAASQAQAMEAGHAQDAAQDATDIPADAAVTTAVVASMPAGRVGNQRMLRAWAVSTTVAAAVCAVLLLLLWRHASASVPERVKPIHQTIQAGDLTAIISYAEKTEDATELHVHVINAGSQPEPANLSLGEDDHDPPVGPILIPAKSTQHRVLRVRKDRDRTRPVRLRLENGPVMEWTEL